MPLKIKIFGCLILKVKILSWDNLHIRGFHGLCKCCHCKSSRENTYHLFIACPVSRIIWHRVAFHFSISPALLYSSIESCIIEWQFKYNSQTTLPFSFYGPFGELTMLMFFRTAHLTLSKFSSRYFLILWNMAYHLSILVVGFKRPLILTSVLPLDHLKYFIGSF